MLLKHRPADGPLRNVARSMGRYDAVSYIEANFLQLFLWERFEGLAPEARLFKPPQPQIVDRVERVKTLHLASRGRRWYGQPREKKVSFLLLVYEEGSYNFRPYSYTPPGILPLNFYSPTSEVRSLRHRSSLPEELTSFLALLTSITLPSRSESGEVLTTYSPQRLLCQFGYDQGAVLVLGSSCIGVWEVEARYVGAGRDALLGDFDSLFWPCRSREGVRSAGGAMYWLRCLDSFTTFVAADSDEPSIVAPIVLIPARDPFLRASKEFDGSMLPVDEAQKQTEDAPAQELVAPPRPNHPLLLFLPSLSSQLLRGGLSRQGGKSSWKPQKIQKRREGLPRASRLNLRSRS